MELFFPLLFGLAVVLTGWPAGFYIFVEWLHYRNVVTRSALLWIILCITGWILAIVGWLAKLMADSGVFLITYISPFLWLIAFFLFRKWKHENRQALGPDYGEEQKDVWPPPPNVPK